MARKNLPGTNGIVVWLHYKAASWDHPRLIIGKAELLAVLCWSGAAKRLKVRDAHIDWDAVTCANRLKLIVQLRRFYLLDHVHQPNLASQSP